jgi:beta-galactosidase
LLSSEARAYLDFDGVMAFPRVYVNGQLEIMRDMGVNAIRTSHNPPAPELLDLCDRMGFVVWDEAFDKWDGTADRVKGEPPLEEYGERQLRNFVMRDRNHPSVVVWSIGNELGGGGRDGVTPQRVKFMSDFVRQYDPTRPVGMGCHIPGLAEQPNFDARDLTGWNYARRYATYRQRYPDKPIIYSESASALSTRGFYDPPLPNRKNEYSKVAWASRPWIQDHGQSLPPRRRGMPVLRLTARPRSPLSAAAIRFRSSRSRRTTASSFTARPC